MIRPSNIFENGMFPIVYDIETYPNYFLFVGRTPNREFVFDNSQFPQLIDFVVNQNAILVGYNNIRFDDIFLKGIYFDQIKSARDAYNLCQEIIMRQSDALLKRCSNLPTPWARSFDLMQVAGKKPGQYRTLPDGRKEQYHLSLKEVSVRIDHAKIQDLPIPPGTTLTPEQKQQVLYYCQNDVDVTVKLWEKCNWMAELRLALESLYPELGLDILSKPNPKISEEILLRKYALETRINVRDLKKMRTEPTDIKMSELLPESLHFESAELQNWLVLLRGKTLEYLKSKDKYLISSIADTITIAGKHANFRLGGAHSKDDPSVRYTTGTHTILDIDVTSYYPQIIVNYQLKPSHLLGTFTEILKEITAMRIGYKRRYQEKKEYTDGRYADALKIVINSIYGKTGNKYSFSYDPKLLYSVTAIGQILMFILADRVTQIDGIELLSVNTDGITCRVVKEKIEDFRNIYKGWEAEYKFNLEESIYKTYAREHINSYVAEYQSGKTKRKGMLKHVDILRT